MLFKKKKETRVLFLQYLWNKRKYYQILTILIKYLWRYIWKSTCRKNRKACDCLHHMWLNACLSRHPGKILFLSIATQDNYQTPIKVENAIKRLQWPKGRAGSRGCEICIILYIAPCPTKLHSAVWAPLSSLHVIISPKVWHKHYSKT